MDGSALDVARRVADEEGLVDRRPAGPLARERDEVGASSASHPNAPPPGGKSRASPRRAIRARATGSGLPVSRAISCLVLSAASASR